MIRHGKPFKSKGFKKHKFVRLLKKALKTEIWSMLHDKTKER
jgi:hypothetical protein